MKTQSVKSSCLHSWVGDVSNGFNQLEVQRIASSRKTVDEHYSDKFEVLASASESKVGFISWLLNKVGIK